MGQYSEANQTEITPSMVKAGGDMLRTYVPLGADYEDLATLVFEAMEDAREAPNPRRNSPADCRDRYR
jgi:hypothetical protein